MESLGRVGLVLAYKLSNSGLYYSDADGAQASLWYHTAFSVFINRWETPSISGKETENPAAGVSEKQTYVSLLVIQIGPIPKQQAEAIVVSKVLHNSWHGTLGTLFMAGCRPKWAV